MQIAPLVRELILAAIEAPWDYKPGSPSERLALVLCDRLTFSNVEPVHLPEPRGAGGTLGEDHRMRAGKIGRKRSKGR